MVKEAEAHAEEDKKRRELIELKNQADTTIYTIDKTLNELGDKLTAEEKQNVKDAQEALKKAVEGDDLEEIKAKMKAMDEVMHRISTKIYQQTQANTQTNADSGKTDEDVVDADFTEENKDNK